MLMRDAMHFTVHMQEQECAALDPSAALDTSYSLHSFDSSDLLST